MSSFYDLSKTPRNILNQAIVRAIVSGNNGAWFDPEDMSTMYQDSAVTTPVTALEQPVGLWLDKSQGFELGAELWNPLNGTYGESTRIALNTYRILSTAGVDSGAQSTTGIFVVGKVYKVSFTVDSISVPGSGLRAGSSGYVFPPQSGYTESLWVANSTSFALHRATGATDIQVSNISVREIKGNHATQSITASRPTLSARYNLLLNSAILSTQSVTTSAAQYTLSFTGTGSVTLSGSATGTLVGTGANNRVSLAFTPTTGTLTLTVTGSVTLAMLAFGTLTTYQAITTATNYDNVGWSRYVRFDGIDDYLNLPYMGLYANGSASCVFSGFVPLLSSEQVIVSESKPGGTNPLYAPAKTKPAESTLSFKLRRDDTTMIADAEVANVALSKGTVFTVIDAGNDILAYQESALKGHFSYTRSGVVTPTATTIGCANFGATYSHFGGSIYGLIVTKSALSDTDRRRCEQYLSRKLSKLGVTLA